ncbi:MAG: hypothetical protein ACK50E_01395 [Bacteroidota bacterium]
MMTSNFILNALKKSSILLFAAILVFTLLVSTGCSSLKKNNCGCPNKKGMVGY